MQANLESAETIKEIEKRALEAARFYESRETGYVHYSKSGNRETIPLYENVLFVLALLRSKTALQIQEAKKKLRALLYFQNHQEGEFHGNFPVYLHEYPLCGDPSLALQLLTPFYWILKEFGAVLGLELRQALEKSVYLALDFSLKQQERGVFFPYVFLVRLAACRHQLGELFQENEWVSQSCHELESLSEKQMEKAWQTKHLADLLVALQMCYPDISTSPWALIWQYMQTTWHADLSSFVGPCVKELEEGVEPKCSLYDLFQGFFFGKKSRRASFLSIHDLHAILIRPLVSSSGPLPVYAERAGEIEGQKWKVFFSENSACTLLEKKGHLCHSQEKFYTPYRLVWGSSEALHSLVCQGGNIESFFYQGDESELSLCFELKEPQEEAGAAKREIEFFIDALAAPSFQIEGKQATTFLLGEEMVVTFPDACFTLGVTFALLEGQGDFLGHLMRSCRPAQILSGTAYDWTFFLRSLRRSPRCVIGVKLKKVAKRTGEDTVDAACSF